MTSLDLPQSGDNISLTWVYNHGITNLFQDHVKSNLVAPHLPDQGDHPLGDLNLVLLADQNVCPAALLHLLHSLATLANDHPYGGVGHHDPQLPVHVPRLPQFVKSLLHQLHQQFDHVRDGIFGTIYQTYSILAK